MDKETLLAKFKQGMGEPNAATQMYENIGISVRTLDTYVDGILPGIRDDNSVDDNFVEGHVSILKAMGGQLRHEMAEFMKKNQPTPPKQNPNEPTPPTPPDKPTGNKELEEMRKELEKLSMAIKGERIKRDETELRNGVIGKAKELKVQNIPLWEDVVRATDVKEGMDATALEAAVKATYENKLKSYFGDGAEPYGGDSWGPNMGNKASEEKLDAFFAMKAREGKFPSKDKH